MAQQLNLYDPRFAPQRLRYSAQQGLAAMVLTLGLGVAVGQGLQWAARQVARQTQGVEARSAPLRQQVVAAARLPGLKREDADGEMARLQVMEASQRRIRAALEAGIAGNREGHANYLVALARQATGQVWITGFSVDEATGAIDLEGRMSDASALTDYLRRLNNEPRFRGRPFAQLSLKAVTGPEAVQNYTEFSLRATALNANAVAAGEPGSPNTGTLASQGPGPAPAMLASAIAAAAASQAKVSR